MKSIAITLGLLFTTPVMAMDLPGVFDRAFPEPLLLEHNGELFAQGLMDSVIATAGIGAHYAKTRPIKWAGNLAILYGLASVGTRFVVSGEKRWAGYTPLYSLGAQALKELDDGIRASAGEPSPYRQDAE